LLEWHDLQLTAQESLRMAAVLGRRGLSRDAQRSLHEQAGGWAAGLVLLLQEASQASLPTHASSHDHQTVFDYFAEEVLRRTDEATRSVLLQSSVMPKMSAPLVQELTGDARSGELLLELSRRNYFTYRLSGKESAYEYHPLFREFLRVRSRESFSPDEMRAIAQRAAQLLASAGESDDAVQLFIEANDWPGAERLILSLAQKLIVVGRHQTLGHWIRMIPQSRREASPWLSFWLGVAVQPLNFSEARTLYTEAYRGFCERDIPTGAFMAWSAAQSTFALHMGDFTPLGLWIAELQKLRERYPKYPSRDMEARVAASVLNALMWREPEHPEIALWAQRVEDTLGEKDIAVAVRVLGGSYLAYYHVLWRADLWAAARVLAMVKPLVSTTELTPLPRLNWHVGEGYYLAAANRKHDCLRVVEKGLQLAEELGVQVADHHLHAVAVYGSLFAGDLTAAGVHLERMRQRLPAAALLDVFHYHYLAAWPALGKGDLASARTHVEACARYAALGNRQLSVVVARIAQAHLQTESGEHAAALANLADTIGWSRKAGYDNARCQMLSLAYVKLNMNDEPGALAALREGFAGARALGVIVPFGVGWCRDAMTKICLKALEAAVEVPHVQEVVRRMRLVPETPPLHLEHWPWALRIYTLGRFAVVKGGTPLAFTGKSQKKPLELLRALIALGGRSVEVSELAQILSPDSEGDKANHAFETILYRLRKLLGEEGCLSLQGGLLTLDPSRCWVDAWALEWLADRVPPASRAQQLFELYQGPFLGKEDAVWAVARRERLRSKFLRAVAQHGQALAEAGEAQAAIDCYVRGLEADPLAEDLYRRLMLAYSGLDRRAEALAAYRRCRIALRSVLDVEPAPETKAIFDAIRAGTS
jgi:DNA-binding SARP family transcriptional activator